VGVNTRLWRDLRAEQWKGWRCPLLWACLRTQTVRPRRQYRDAQCIPNACAVGEQGCKTTKGNGTNKPCEWAPGD
jgi:hypothetical protein